MKTPMGLQPSMAKPIKVRSIRRILDNIETVPHMTMNLGCVGQPLVTATLRKVEVVRRRLDRPGYETVDFQIGGDVSFQNIARMIGTGANMLAGGTFSMSYSISQAVDEVRAIVQNTERAQ
jgi:pentose-5-phosphate-3-epimerase